MGKYTRHNPGIAIVDYADLLNWDQERDDEYWKCIYNHYQQQTQFDFICDIVATTTVNELSKDIAERIGFNWELFSRFPKKIYLKIEDELFRIEDTQIDFARISKHYDLKDELCIYFMFSNQAGIK